MSHNSCSKCKCYVVKKCKPCDKSDSGSDSDSDSDCNCNCNSFRETCVKREFLNKSNKLRCLLGEKQYVKCSRARLANKEDIRYKNFHYNGLFHKSLSHNIINGSLINDSDYTNIRNGTILNKQLLLNSVPLHPGSLIKLTNPLASASTILIGAPQCAFHVRKPPTLSSDAGAAEMVELYSMVIARDVNFADYATDPIIALLLTNTYMNSPSVLANLPYKSPVPFVPKTLFKIDFPGEAIGPYMSQLLLLDIPFEQFVSAQKNTNPVARNVAIGQVEWGINKTETINMENGLLNLLPPPNPANLQQTYISDGRSLAALIQKDIVYQLFFQGAIILNKLGVSPNPGFPSYLNQASLITNPGISNIVCSVATVTDLALKHAWYWKWQKYRKLRPEVFGLWTDNVIDGTVPNLGNYDISNVLLSNNILTDIHALYGSYTLPQCFIEGSPAHPAYPSGHATLSGACATVLKIFFNGENLWSTLPGVITGLLAPVPGPVQADATGANLIPYTDPDAVAMTVGGEINKLATNIAVGRLWAGVHYRSDAVGGLLLGEKVAVKFMEDMLSSSVENNLDKTVPHVTFRKFNGELQTIKPTTCYKK